MGLTWRTLFSLAAGAALLAASSMLQASSRRPDYIITPKATLLLMPATIVASGDIERQSWSSDGAYLAVAVRNKTKSWVEAALTAQVNPRRPPNPPAELFVWDRQTGSVKKLWSSDDPEIRIDDLVWIHGSPELLVSASEAKPTAVQGEPQGMAGVLAINATSGHFHWLPNVENALNIHIEASPTKPLAEMMVAAGGPDPKTLTAFACIVDDSGNVMHRQAMSVQTMYWPTAWSADGSSCLYLDYRKKLTMRLQDDGTLAKTSEPVYAKVERNPDLVMTQRPSLAKIRTERKSLNTIWLSSRIPTDHPDAFVSADGKGPSLSPSQDSLFYVEGGIAKVRTWMSLNDEQKKALMDALKQDALDSAKQVALGIIMFSADNDDVIPGAGGLDDLLPYLGDSSLLDGFNYTPPSDLNTTKWTSPGETVMGTVSGPGGSAVAYGDGHVVWRPNP